MSQMDKLLNAVKKAKSSGFAEREDDYFYYPNRDAAGNGSAVIRFLPSISDDEVPFVKLYTHGFKGSTGKWLIDNCLTTIEKECPVCKANSENYASMSKDDARKKGMNRKVSYIARILVIEDKKSPENEGKVFLFKFGTKVFDKIADALQPEFEDDKPVNVFDLEEGANFKLKIRKVDGQTNYDKSEFESPSACEVKVEKQYSEENNPQKFIEAKNFKSAEDLQTRLDFVLGNAQPARRAEPKDDSGDDLPFDIEDDKPVAPKSASKRAEVAASNDDDDDDDVLAMMRKLAEPDN